MDVVGKEEQFEHGKDDEELDEYYSPQRASDGHASEAIVVEVPYRGGDVFESCCFHQ